MVKASREICDGPHWWSEDLLLIHTIAFLQGGLAVHRYTNCPEMVADFRSDILLGYMLVMPSEKQFTLPIRDEVSSVFL